MPEQISYDDKTKVIVVVSVGDISYPEWMNSISIIEELCVKNRCNNILVDISGQTSTPGTIDLYEFGKNLPMNLRWAVVCPEDLSEDHEFLKLVGINRGKNICSFHNRNDAISWLTRKSNDKTA